MLRFQAVPYASGPRQDDWPSFSLSEASTVFSPRPPLRKLTAVIDYELLQSFDEENLTAGALLGGLLSHPYVALFRFSDHGPPRDAERATSRGLGEYTPGWIEVRRPVADHVPVLWSRAAGTVGRGGLSGNGPDVAARDTDSGAYADREAADAAAQRRLDAIAVQAAAQAKADIFITERPYLHSLTWSLARGVLVAAPEPALRVVSLYLRRQGAFIVDRSLDGTATDEFNQGLFYWVGTRELLPEGWRWFSACVQHGHQDDSIIYLGQSLFQRVQRALQARDAAHWALNQPQTHDTADEALGNVDLVLLGLMAALDVAARVAHRALGLEGSERAAAWQRDGWLRRLRAVAPELAAVVASGSPGRHTLSILNALRNSIHGAALAALGVSSMAGHRDGTLVGLPHTDADAVVAAMDALGGRTGFGVRELLPDRLHADPGVLLDAICCRTIVLLNELMRLTPVERLADVALEPSHHTLPSDGPFDAWSRRSVRWQLGLELPDGQS